MICNTVMVCVYSIYHSFELKINPPRNKSANNQPTLASKKSAISISDDIMQENILDALEKANIENSQ